MAQTVSRMGKENVQRKRVLAEKFASQELKAYMVLVDLDCVNSSAKCLCSDVLVPP